MFIRFDYRERALISAFQSIQKSKLAQHLQKEKEKEMIKEQQQQQQKKKQKLEEGKQQEEGEKEGEGEEAGGEREPEVDPFLANFGWRMEEGRLDIGDVLINDEILIERKTLADLLASLKDGRYEEQSYRLQQQSRISPHNIWYMLEGNPLMIYNEQSQQSIYTAMVSLNVTKGFSVIRNASVNESALFLFHAMQKLTKEKEKERKRGGAPPVGTMENGAEDDLDEEFGYVKACSSQNKRKQEFVTPENIDMLMLCQIPLIKDQTAKSILDHFGTIWEMTRRYALHGDEIFQDLRIRQSTGKKVKLSESIQTNLKKYIFASSNLTFTKEEEKQEEDKEK